jgi:hypothetical protein
MPERTPEVRFGLTVSLEELLLLNSLVQESLESPSSCDWDCLITNISQTTKYLTSTNPNALIGLHLSETELDSLYGLHQNKYPSQTRPLTITYLSQRIENGIERIVKKSVASDEPDYPSYSELPVHVFTNLGGSPHMTSINQFATLREAQAWIDLMKHERPECYCIVDEMELDESA